jgi:putative ABC transport system substrate-binding protein
LQTFISNRFWQPFSFPPRCDEVSTPVEFVAERRIVKGYKKGATREVKEVLPAAARALGLTVRSWEVRTADDFEKIFTALGKERPDGLYAPSAGSVMRSNLKRIAGFALKSRLASVFTNRDAVDAGGLMAYGPSQAENLQRALHHVDKILKGAKPADLPIEQPTKFEFIINLKTAKQIGLTIPPNVLARADRVIR